MQVTLSGELKLMNHGIKKFQLTKKGRLLFRFEVNGHVISLSLTHSHIKRYPTTPEWIQKGRERRREVLFLYGNP